MGCFNCAQWMVGRQAKKSEEENRTRVEIGLMDKLDQCSLVWWHQTNMISVFALWGHCV